MNALETALYSHLIGGTELMAKLGGTVNVFNQIAPRGAALAYVVYGIQGGGDENITPARFKNLVYSIKAVSESSMKDAGEIDDEIDGLMHSAALTVTGWGTMWCMREADFGYTETTPEGRNVWHVGGNYRIRLYKK